MGQYVVFFNLYEGKKVIKYVNSNVFSFGLKCKMPVKKFRYSSRDGKMMSLKKIPLTHIQC